MFAKTIIDSDMFLDMPVTARLLYYDLAMRADDDGFVNSPKKIMRMIGASQDDLGILAMKKFIIPFDNGVVVIKHWRIHNYIRKDTYNETTYTEQKALLKLDDNKEYVFVDEPSTERGLPEDTDKSSIDKISLDKNSNSTTEKETEIPLIPLDDGSEWEVPQDYYEECVKNYPDADVLKELSKMRMWCLSNPTRLKKKTGVKRFINNWLSKARPNEGKSYKANPNKKPVSERLKGYEK